MSYLVRYIYPGDYGSYVDYDPDYEWDYCTSCAEWHVKGNPLHQWRDSVIAAPKRYDNDNNDFLNDVLNRGIRIPINIDIIRHKVVANGHHRVFAALDLGWKYIPASFSDANGPISYPIPISSRFLQPWNGKPYTESSLHRLLA